MTTLSDGLGLQLVGAVACDRHRFVECGDFPRDVLGDHFETGSTNGVFDKQVVGESPGGSPIADDAAGGGHRIDDDVIADGDAGHVRADLDDFACGFVAEWRVPLARRNSTDSDVERIGATDSAGAHPDQYVVRPGLRAFGIEDFRLAAAGDESRFHGRFHDVPSNSISKVSRYSAKIGSSCSTVRPYWSRL